MRQAFDDAEIEGWDDLEGTYGLPVPNDEHVVAAAVVGGAGAIVTYNLKDFPLGYLPEGLEVLTPQEFLLSTVVLDPRRAWAAVEQIARRSGRQGLAPTVPDILDLLTARYGLREVVDVLRTAPRPG